MSKPGDQFGYQLGGVRLAAPAFYVLAISCFFFTFFNLRCGKVKMASISGVDVVVGGEIKMDNNFLSNWPMNKPDTSHNGAGDIFKLGERKERLPVNYWMLGALVTGVAALAFSFFSSLRFKLAQVGLGAATVLLMIVSLFTLNIYLLRILRLDGVFKQRPQGLWNSEVLRLQPTWAFWCSLGAFALALLMIVFRHQRLKIDREDEQAMELFNPGNGGG